MQRGIRKSRPTTMAEFMQNLRDKNMGKKFYTKHETITVLGKEKEVKRVVLVDNTATKTPLQLERQFVPQQNLKQEEETMYFGA